MPKIKRDVVTYQEDYICDKCGEGFMQHDGKFCDNPENPKAHWSHYCNKCGTTQGLTSMYPSIRNEVKEVK